MSEDQLTLPDGYKLGCLPRRSRFGEVCAPFADKIDVIDRKYWPDLLANISLRSKVPVVLDQGSVGSCATESSTSSVHVTRAMNGLPFDLLNPLFVYHTTSGGQDQGSNIDDNLVFVRDKGIAPESVWPRSKGFRAQPSDEAYREALKYRIDEFYDISSFAEFGTALLLGFPVVFGYSGHSVLAVALKDVDTVIYLNSWSDSWGDKGYGTLRTSSIHWGYGAWAVRSVRLPDESPDPPIPTFGDTGMDRFPDLLSQEI